jgi:hypothetical protein
MRYLLLVPICLAAGCSGGGEDANKAAAVATPATMPAGQYATEVEVTAFRSTDNQTPAITAKQGDKSTAAGCVTAGSPPPAALFTGEAYKCNYQSSYFKDGILNASLDCTAPKITGTITMTVQGSYTAKDFEATVETSTYLPGPGDFAMTRKVTGRLTGPTCAPAEGDAGGNASATKTG